MMNTINYTMGSRRYKLPVEQQLKKRTNCLEK